MINANELRVGNNIWNGKIVAVYDDRFHFNDGISTWDSSEMRIESIYPIPLTPEILEKCGFSNTPKIDWFTLCPDEDCHLRLWKGIFYWQSDWGLTPVNNLFPIINLHDLQNIYFATTHKELKYQP